MNKPKCKLIGEDGNIINLLAIARRTLIRAGMPDKASEMFNEVTKTHGYDEALMTISKYVDIK